MGKGKRKLPKPVERCVRKLKGKPGIDPYPVCVASHKKKLQRLRARRSRGGRRKR